MDRDQQPSLPDWLPSLCGLGQGPDENDVAECALGLSSKEQTAWVERHLARDPKLREQFQLERAISAAAARRNQRGRVAAAALVLLVPAAVFALWGPGGADRAIPPSLQAEASHGAAFTAVEPLAIGGFSTSDFSAEELRQLAGYGQRRDAGATTIHFPQGYLVRAPEALRLHWPSHNPLEGLRPRQVRLLRQDSEALIARADLPLVPGTENPIQLAWPLEGALPEEVPFRIELLNSEGRVLAQSEFQIASQAALAFLAGSDPRALSLGDRASAVSPTPFGATNPASEKVPSALAYANAARRAGYLELAHELLAALPHAARSDRETALLLALEAALGLR